MEVPQDTVAIGFIGRSGDLIDAIGLTYESGRSSIRNILRSLPGRNRY